MHLAKYKQAYRTLLVKSGSRSILTLDDPALARYTTRWFRQFNEVIPPVLRDKPRLLNHFKVGADPEFILVDETGHRVDAKVAGLVTGLYVGADQNTRLVEVRPKPDVFCLRVLASILTSLKWFAYGKPNLLGHAWKCGAFLEGDGLGGHVHFGRKRQSRPMEVVALDAVSAVLKRTKMFSTKQWDQRMAGDERNQEYGKYSEYRLQSHGYEYRTLPSWLESPFMAYLCLVCCKLAVLEPGLVQEWFSDEKISSNGIRNLLAYYQGVDDDAAIALTALNVHGFPRYTGIDIKKHWGLEYPTVHEHDVAVWPRTMAPSNEDLTAIFEHLTTGKALKPTAPVVTWAYSKVPRGFTPATITFSFGMGEILYDVLTSDKAPVRFYAQNDKQVMFSGGWRKYIPDLPTRVHNDFGIKSDWYDDKVTLDIFIGRPWRKEVTKVRKMLFSGLLPLWSAKAPIEPDAYARWLAGAKPKEFKTQFKTVYERTF